MIGHFIGPCDIYMAVNETSHITSLLCIAHGDPCNVLYIWFSHAGMPQKAQRPAYKFNKKAMRSKSNSGTLRDTGSYDGGALATGRKGGIARMV